MDKKIAGGVAAVVGALMYGGAQLLDMEERIAVIEGLHPEIEQEELNEKAEELKEEPQKPSEEPEEAKEDKEQEEKPEEAPEAPEGEEAADPIEE
tara:strand:- start:1383 stop:1667 length:285 start_codon:yes stop_codon:yes gene_type:complete